MIVEGVKEEMIENEERMEGMKVGKIEIKEEKEIEMQKKIMKEKIEDIGKKEVEKRNVELVEKIVKELERKGRKNGKGL